MKKIRIRFVNVSDTFDEENNIITDILRKYYEVEISNDPQYLFFSVFSINTYPEHLKYDCIKIFFTGENLVPDFNLCDYAIGFEYMDFGDRYLRFPNYCYKEYAVAWERAEDRGGNLLNGEKEREEFCSFIYSNGKCDFRNQLFSAINAYKTVHAGGPWMNNIGGNIGGGYLGRLNMNHSISFR